MESMNFREEQFHLISLEVADKMPPNVGDPLGLERLIFGQELLDIVFAKIALTETVQSLNRFYGLKLAYRNERWLVGPTRTLGSFLNFLANLMITLDQGFHGV